MPVVRHALQAACGCTRLHAATWPFRTRLVVDMLLVTIAARSVHTWCATCAGTEHAAERERLPAADA